MTFPLPLLVTAAGLAAVGAPLRAAGRRVGLPPAVSLLALGVACGPATLDLLPNAWLDERTTLSAAAFVVLLLRAGLGLSPGTLHAIAPAALRLGTVPVIAVAAVFTALAHALWFDSWAMSALAGVLVAAVSPAVILPTMLAHKDAGRGGPRHVPDLIMGQTLVNSMLAPVLLLGLLGVLTGSGPGPANALLVAPFALLAGAVVGFVAAGLLRADRVLGKAKVVPPARVALACGLLLAGGLALYFGCARVPWIEGVVATLALAAFTRQRLGDEPRALRHGLRRVWSVGEIFLFTNLGSALRLEALGNGRFVVVALLVLATALTVRVVVARALVRTTALREDEQRYVALAHVPKATIQAVYGAVPLLLFQRLRPDLVPDGEALLLLAVLAIVATAPLGAMALEHGARALDDAIPRPANARIARLPESALYVRPRPRTAPRTPAPLPPPSPPCPAAEPVGAAP